MKQGIIDILLFVVYGVLIFGVVSAYASGKMRTNPALYRYFMPAFRVKMAGCLGFILIYIFYYKDGDTFAFFHWAEQLLLYFFKSPGDAIQFYLNSDSEPVFNRFYYNAPPSRYFYLLNYQSAEVTFTKISAIISLLAGRSYMSASLLFSLISFFGLWRMFRVFYDINPALGKQFSWAIMYVPSVLFWGSGMMKDTVTLAGTGLITYCLYFGLIKRKNIVANVILMILVGYLIARIKGYILLGFVPAASLWLFLTYRSWIKSSFLRIAFLPFFLALSGAMVYLFVTQLAENLGEYSIQNLQARAEGFQRWHTVASGDEGSGYTLGTEGDFSLRTMLVKLPLALNVTFFRPYLWQANSPVMLLAAVESTILFFFFLYVLFLGRWRLLQTIGKDPNIIFTIVFALVFGFAVGFTSYNFGALVRYKIPCIPFFICALILIYDKVRKPAAAAQFSGSAGLRGRPARLQ